VTIENQRAKRSIGTAFRGRNPLHDCFEDFFDADTFFCTRRKSFGGFQQQALLYLFSYPIDIGRR
jgi:hypothetical protein